MKRAMKYFLAAAVALGVVGGVAASKGDGYCDQHDGRHGDRMVKKVTKKLDLDQTQQALLKDLQVTMQEKMQAMHATKEESKAAFMGLFGPQFDQSQALALMQQKADSVNQNAPELVAAFAQFYDQLNPEQQAKMVKFMEKRGGRGMGMFGGFMGHKGHKGHHKNGHDDHDQDHDAS